MASPGRRAGAPLDEQLTSQPYRFDFFQAVRLLEWIARRSAREGSEPSRLPIGKDHPPGREIVHFRALVSHGFPPGSISSIVRPAARDTGEAEDPPPEMVVSFMGLTGPSGVLPQHYTKLLIDRVRNKDYALRDWLDLFHHRIISLFYRAWEKYRFPVAYERAALDPDEKAEDPLTSCLYCLTGLGTGGLRDRLSVRDEAFLYYGGYFAHSRPSAICLEQMLADCFQLPVAVRQFEGQWLYLSREDQSRTPSRDQPAGQNIQLGVSVVVGERVWDVQGKFRLRLGPLRYDEFRRFAPPGDRLVPFCQMVRTYVGPEFDFDVQPILLAEEIPWCQLGGNGPDPSLLGWNTWLRSLPSRHDADDAVFASDGQPTRV